MAEQHRLRIRRGGVDELRKLTDPAEFAVAAADYLGIPPLTLPPSFRIVTILDASLLKRWNVGMRSDRKRPKVGYII